MMPPTPAQESRESIKLISCDRSRSRLSTDKPKVGMLFESYLEERHLLEGNTRYILWALERVDRARYQMVLVSPVKSDFFGQVSELQCECVHLPASLNLLPFGGVILKQNLWRRAGVLLSLIYYNLKVYAFLRSRRIDFMHCNNLRSLLLVGLAAKLTGIPVMWWIKAQLENPFLDRLGFFLADRIVFQNQTNRDRCYPRLIRHYADKIGIVQGGVDLREIDQTAERVTQDLKHELNWRADRLNLILLARLTPRKGAHMLLEALLLVREVQPQVALYFVGDDTTPEHQDYLTGLREFISRHQVRDVYFTGWRADCLNILALMDLLVVPSSDEGLPTVILEAMAMGKPVIATKAGGVAEVIRDGENGILLEIGDVQGLAQAIITLAQDPQLRRRLGDRGRQMAFQDYSIDAQIDNLQAIYREMVR
jgi:glycosyltransferase involved in cell wall biosynthesis